MTPTELQLRQKLAADRIARALERKGVDPDFAQVVAPTLVSELAFPEDATEPDARSLEAVTARAYDKIPAKFRTAAREGNGAAADDLFFTKLREHVQKRYSDKPAAGAEELARRTGAPGA